MYCDVMHYFKQNISSAARVIFRFLFCAIQIAAVVSVSSCSEPKRPAPQADVLSRSLRQEKIENMINTGRYREAIALLDRFSQDYDLPPREMLDVYYNLAYCYQATGDYDRVLDNIACIMNLQIDDSLEYEKADSYFLLARVYRLAGESHKSDSIFSDVEARIKKWGTATPRLSRLAARFHIEKSSAFLDAGKYKEAFAELKKASNYKMDQETGQLIDMGMAELFSRMGEPEMSEEYYKSYLAKAVASINRLYALYNYSELLVDLGRYEEAADSCRSLIFMTEQNGIRHVRAATYGVLARALYGMGKYKDAYEMHEAFYNGMDSVLWQKGPYITAEYEKRLTSSGTTHKHLTDISDAMGAAGIAVVIIVIISLWAFIRHRRRDGVSSPESNTVVSCDRDESGDVEEGSPDTMSPLHLSLQIAQANTTIQEIAKIGCDASIDDDTRRRRIGDILKTIEVNKNLWEVFMTCFGKMHPSFMRTLYGRHPDLSKGEIRMCAFIVMAITTKEIAAITNRSTRTVESMKYRLHKKLGLDSSVSTESYLRNFM